MPQSKQRALSREIILSTALDVVDEEGLSALSLRSLGKRLGVSQAAFLSLFPRQGGAPGGHCRAGLAPHVRVVLGPRGRRGGRFSFDAHARGVGADQGTPASPLLTYMRTYAHCLASTLRSHPGAVMLLLTHPMSTPEQLSLLARVFVTLARRGFTPNADMLGLVNAVSIYTTAFVGRRGRSARGWLPPSSPPTCRPRAPRSTPRTRRHCARSSRTLLDGRYDFNAQFERGLEAILRRLALRLTDQLLDLAHDARGSTERGQLRARPSDP